MPRPKRWKVTSKKHGIMEVDLTSWKYFDDYIRDEMLDYRAYIWRGQRCSNWVLEPTLDRALKGHSAKVVETMVSRHLTNFKFATRGRRGPNPPPIQSENDWWALGQHNGLKTPLLDWTTSPFAAAYFAFVEVHPGQTGKRSIYALARGLIEQKSNEISQEYEGTDRAPIIECVRPLSDENARLVNQGGLFTRAPVGVDVETWVKQNLPEDERFVVLLKLFIPNKDRALCLRSLNRMNINHLTLFPDLYGSSKHCNMDLEIDKY